ncbi:MAG: hypothetical protein RQ723_10575 [Desulfuromonadales bacterium]|nr:hypothetical protein [Desulfuromonadales bacterium]
MTQFQGRYQVESTRLPGWDYALPGYYFVTLCTRDRACFFGEFGMTRSGCRQQGRSRHGFGRRFRNTSQGPVWTNLSSCQIIFMGLSFFAVPITTARVVMNVVCAMPVPVET